MELTEKIEANFYSQDLTPATPQPRQNEKPEATKISGKEILEAIRLMDAEERRLCKPCAEKPLIRANVQTVCRKCAAAFLHKERTPNLTI